MHSHPFRLPRWVAALWLVACGPLPAQEVMPPTSDAVKAAYVYNFTKYLDWPAKSFASPGSAIVIATACPSAFDQALHEVAGGRTVNGRPVEVMPVRYVEQLRTAHALYVCAEEELAAAALIEAARQKAIATIGESPWFAEQGGMIVFVVEDRKIRFDITLPARPAGVRVSAQLQKLARRVAVGIKAVSP